VKGRLLNEQQIDLVVSLLSHNKVVFEISATDLEFLSEADIVKFKKSHFEEMLARAVRFRSPDSELVDKAAWQIETTSLPLYIQALLTFETIHSIINHVPLYFAQRQPRELGSFTWVVDGKEPAKVTNWEMWWSWFAKGALASMSKSRPRPVLDEADYSYFNRFDGRNPITGDVEGTDNALLLADLRFSTASEPGLELVDIVTSATRRALMGNLAAPGWQNIPRLMIHRKEPYINFVVWGEGPDRLHQAAYGRVVENHFSSGGKLMLAPRFIRRYEAERDTLA
jgi:hypothetical protein